MHHYDFVEQLVSKNRYDFFYGEVGHLITCLLVDIGKQYGMKILWPMMSFWPNRFFLCTGGRNALKDEVSRCWAHVKTIGVTDSEKKWAISYIHEIRNRMPLMPHMKGNNSLGVHSEPDQSNAVVRKINTLLKLLIYHKSYYKYNYYGENILGVLKNKLKKITPSKYYYSVPQYEKPIEGEKYILFYLHYEPDLSTLVWATYFKDQILFIKNLAFCVPFGYRLYVKEHPLMINRPRDFYENLKKIPQVRLIRPDESSDDLIRKCAVVITITGTIGWEALLLNKPVITFGNVYYNCFEGVTVLKNWETLNHTICKLIEQEKTIQEKTLVEFVVAVKRCTFPGDWFSANQYGLDEKNVREIAQSFKKKMVAEYGK